MKQKLFEALKAKFSGVDADILDRIATMLAKTVTEESGVTTAVEGVTQEFISVIEGYGDSRATGAQKTAVANYERKHNLKDGVKVAQQQQQEPPKSTEGGDDMPAWAKTLIESNQQLSERLNRLDTERTTTARRQQLATITDKLPEALRKPYERMSVDNLKEEEFTQLLSDVTTEVNGIVSGMNAKGAVFGKPAAHNGGGNQGGELTEEQKKAIGTREGGASADGQPF